MEKQEASIVTAASPDDSSQLVDTVSFEPGLAAVVTENTKMKKKRNVSAPRVPPNLLKEVFLKKILYLDKSLSKFAVVGIFEHLNRQLGLLIKSGRSFTFWNFDTFNHLCVKFDNITQTLTEGDSSFKITGNDDEIKIKKVFGNFYVSVRDKERRNILLNKDEWTQLLRNLHEVQNHFTQLFVCEDLIQLFVDRVILAEGEDDAIPPAGLPSHLVNQLVDEVLFFKKWLLWRQ